MIGNQFTNINPFLQVQAIVAATVVSIFAIVVNIITDRGINGSYILLLIASAVFTATTTCFVLGKQLINSLYLNNICLLFFESSIRVKKIVTQSYANKFSSGNLGIKIATIVKIDLYGYDTKEVNLNKQFFHFIFMLYIYIPVSFEK